MGREAYEADYLMGANQKIPDWPVRAMFLGEVVTTTRSGIMFWFGVQGLAQVISFRACCCFWTISWSPKTKKRKAKWSIQLTIVKHPFCARHYSGSLDVSKLVSLPEEVCLLSKEMVPSCPVNKSQQTSQKSVHKTLWGPGGGELSFDIHSKANWHWSGNGKARWHAGELWKLHRGRYNPCKSKHTK